MSPNEFQNIQKQLLQKMRFSDTTIKNIKDSPEYKENCAYNSAIRDCIDVLKTQITSDKQS